MIVTLYSTVPMCALSYSLLCVIAGDVYGDADDDANNYAQVIYNADILYMYIINLVHTEIVEVAHF